MSALRAVFRDRQRLRTMLGHQDGVLELGGEAAVFRPHGPAVAFALNRIFDAGVDHRLDGEAQFPARAAGGGPRAWVRAESSAADGNCGRRRGRRIPRRR